MNRFTIWTSVICFIFIITAAIGGAIILSSLFHIATWVAACIWLIALIVAILVEFYFIGVES